MKKFLILFPFLLFCFPSFSQIEFVNGYVITYNGDSISCQIKDKGWKSNPETIEYRISSEPNSIIAGVDKITEFGVKGSFKYKKFITQIETSSSSLIRASDSREPEFVTDTVFLKVLIESTIGLLSYTDENKTNLFYQNEQNELIPLIYKKYINGEQELMENNQYKQELFLNYKCASLKKSSYSALTYKEKSLINFFQKYLSCKEVSYQTFERGSLRKRSAFNLSVRLGLNHTTLAMDKGLSDWTDTEFDPTQNLRIGLELEYILPFNQNKWSLMIEPSYRTYENMQELQNQNIYVGYRVLELPVGLRYYLFLDKKNKLFINATFATDFNINSGISYDFAEPLKVGTTIYFTYGLGYNYNNTFNLEFRYYNKNLLQRNYVEWDVDFRTFSFIVGYNLFTLKSDKGN